MLTELWGALQANPILAGGIGTVAFGSLMYVVRSVPRWISAAASRMLTVELTLNSQSGLYRELLETLSQYRVRWLSRNFTTNMDGQIVAGYGQSIAVYRGRPVLFSRRLLEGKMRLDEELKLTLFSRDPKVLSSLIEEAHRPVGRDQIQVYMGGATGYWRHATTKRKRSLGTVFTNDAVKQAVVAKIDWFLANEDWYLRRGIPYKLVILLHGEPGTGKTSLVYGIASHYSRSLCSIGSIVSVDSLLQQAPRDSFVVIEDIDMLTVSREEQEAKGGPTPAASGTTQASRPPNEQADGDELNALQALINTLDGIGTPHGLILFVTTNYRDRLDSALIRPGRVDCDIEIGRLDREQTEAMFVAFYGEAERPAIERYTRSAEFRPHTGADLQVLFMTEGAERAVECLTTGERRVAGDNVISMGDSHGHVSRHLRPEGSRPNAVSGRTQTDGNLARHAAG
jgi:chaperone BCS1